MKLPPLKIGDLTARVPLIQGGMSIRVSTSKLAAPVAECGGIGVIGGSGIPEDELKEDIIKAHSETDGIIAVNIMYAMKNFYELVIESIEAGVDMIVTGAGFSRDIFKIGKKHNIPIANNVSNTTLARLAEKLLSTLINV
jgi:nitronate monooxygenase